MVTFIVVEGNIVLNALLRFLKNWDGELPQGFFLGVSKEVFHGCIVPTIASA
jgi:hypothetical protein